MKFFPFRMGFQPAVFFAGIMSLFIYNSGDCAILILPYGIKGQGYALILSFSRIT